jgi:CBS domain-containing protein
MSVSPAIDLQTRLLGHPLFKRLGERACAEWAGHFQTEVVAVGQPGATGAQLRERLVLVLEGRMQLSLVEAAGGGFDLTPGLLYGAGAAPYGDPSGWQLRAVERSTLAWLPAAELAALYNAHPLAATFLAPLDPSTSTTAGDPHLSLTATPVRSLLRRPPVTLPPTATIVQAAQTMRDHRVSSVLLIEQGHLFGLVTDRDLRNRALAAGLDPSLPVLEIATVAPMTIDINRPAFEALLLMARFNIHHVPVLDGQRVAGMVTATDVTEQHSTSAVYLAGEIHKQSRVEDLVLAAGKVKALQRSLAAAAASAHSTGHIITTITDAITARLQYATQFKHSGIVPIAYLRAGGWARGGQHPRALDAGCARRRDQRATCVTRSSMAGLRIQHQARQIYVFCAASRAWPRVWMPFRPAAESASGTPRRSRWHRPARCGAR